MQDELSRSSMNCDFCTDEFSPQSNPDNCYIGYQRDSDGNIIDRKITLCKDCHAATIFGYTGLHLNLYSYPMKWRAESIPPGPHVKNAGQTGPWDEAETWEEHLCYLIEDWASKTENQQETIEKLERRRRIAQANIEPK